jgi:hypothetical protein
MKAIQMLATFVVAVLLSGCATLNPQPMHAQVGQDFNAVNTASNDTGNGDLEELIGINIAGAGTLILQGHPEYENCKKDVYRLCANRKIFTSDKLEPYKFYETHHATLKNIFDPAQPLEANPSVFVFKQNKLVLITTMNAFVGDMDKFTESEARKERYGADYDLANKYIADFGVLPSTQDIADLHAHGVQGAAGLGAAEAEMAKYGSLYAKGEVVLFLHDTETAKNKRETIAQAREARKAEEERLARQQEREAARQRAQAAAEAANQRAQIYASRAKMKFTTIVYCAYPYSSDMAANMAFSLTQAASQDNTYIFAQMLTSGAYNKYCEAQVTSNVRLSKEAITNAKEVTRKGKLVYFVTNLGGGAVGFMGRQ